MDGMARSSGRQFQKLTIGGKEYTLRAPSVGRLIADMEAYVVSLRQNPLSMAVEAVRKLPADLTDQERARFEAAIWKAAEAASVRTGAISVDEMNEFTSSPRGLAYMFHTCLEADHGDEIQTVDQALGLIETYVEAEGKEGLIGLRMMILSATGEGDAKNSSGPSPKSPGKKKRGKRRKKKSQAGPKFSSSVRKNTDSQPTT